MRTGHFVALGQSVFLYRGFTHYDQASSQSVKHIFTKIARLSTILIHGPATGRGKEEHLRAHCVCCTPFVGIGAAGAGVPGAGEAEAGTGVGVGFGTLIVDSGEPLLSFCFLAVFVIVSTLALIQPGLRPS